MEIDYDYLRTGTAIGFRASRELCSNYLVMGTFCYVDKFCSRFFMWFSQLINSVKKSRFFLRGGVQLKSKVQILSLAPLARLKV